MKRGDKKLDAAGFAWLAAMQSAVSLAWEKDEITVNEKTDFDRIAQSCHARLSTLHHDLYNARKRGRERTRLAAQRKAAHEC